MALVFVFFVVGFSVITYRCLYLHMVGDPKLEKIAKSQYRAKLQEAPPRGNIYDANGEELAISVPTSSLAARPGRMKSREQAAVMLASLLKAPLPEIQKKLDPSKKYVWVKRHLSPREKEEVAASSLEGLEFVKGAKRFYPNREMGSQILGAVGNENEGLSGIELFYDRYLRGLAKNAAAYRDARGRMFETEETLSRAVSGPHHLTLTIRKNIQYAAEHEMKETCENHGAKSCTAVVLDPGTGHVLAMASFPSFNPNMYQSYDLGLWKNLAVTDTFEPGSTFKTILATAAIENEAVKPTDRFFCENGDLRIGDHIVHDHAKYGMLSVRDIIKVSSNIGIYKIGRKLGKKGFGEIIERFGFGKKTGIDYPGEVAGYVPPFKSWQEIEFATISFGQGVRVTPLQLASSFATLANGGVRLRPTLVSRVTDSEGRTVLENRPKVEGEVVAPQTARLMISLLEEVTREGGTATAAALPGYTVAGKTGTSQKVVGGKYSHTKYVASFVGIVPAEHPRLVVLVTIDEPQGQIYGGLVAAPAFRRIAWAALTDLGVPPEKASVPQVTQAALMGKPEGAGAALMEGIPDFRGYSKRKVLAILDERGLTCETQGAGIAAEQTPSPGSRLEDGTVCRIIFRTE